MKVLLVGDADQLPSVGPGQIFADLLKIPEIPLVKLDKIFRQGDDSTITDLAHHIKDGQLPSDFTAKNLTVLILRSVQILFLRWLNKSQVHGKKEGIILLNYKS